MQLIVDKSALSLFRRRAMRRYPKEHLESLWGRVLKDKSYMIVEFRVEELAYSSSSAVAAADEDAGRFGIKDGNLTQLGTIHSHPYSLDGAPSEEDWIDSLESGERITGVLAIKKVNGRAKTSAKFYLARALCETRIV